MNKIRILIADDHKIFRDGIRALLDKEKHISVVGDVANASEVIDFLEKNEADVILMDIDMGETDGIDATFILKKKYPEVNVLALSMYGEHNYILKMIEAGANGYILKNAGKEELLTAINSVAAGGTYFSREVSLRLFENINKLHKTTSGNSEIPLTNREIEILKLIAQEYSNAEIADKLFISIRTVDTHRRNLIAKLDVKNTAGLVKYAFRKGLIE
jgi:DNA-binding NarL/FixJ family response regulator